MTTINILVTGGAGYIGSHTSRQLIEAGYSVTVVDNLYSGHRWAIPDEATFIEGDVGDHPLMESVLKERKINAVVHFAGHIVVPESVSDPLKYYSNNALNSGRLIAACQEAGVEHFVFSSTAATDFFQPVNGEIVFLHLFHEVIPPWITFLDRTPWQIQQIYTFVSNQILLLPNRQVIVFHIRRIHPQSPCHHTHLHNRDSWNNNYHLHHRCLVPSTIGFQCPNLHFTKTLSAKLCLSAKWLLGN